MQNARNARVLVLLCQVKAFISARDAEVVSLHRDLAAAQEKVSQAMSDALTVRCFSCCVHWCCCLPLEFACCVGIAGLALHSVPAAASCVGYAFGIAQCICSCIMCRLRFRHCTVYMQLHHATVALSALLAPSTSCVCVFVSNTCACMRT
jgi:hypothetical protein